MKSSSSRTPQISVVLGTYNRADKISLAINSILKQTFKDFELIIVDDGSTDGTWDLLHAYMRQDERIKVIRQENGGVASARNTGVRHARGHYIAVMDDDDISMPGRLQAQLNYLEQNPQHSACVCAMAYRSDAGIDDKRKTKKALRKARRGVKMKGETKIPPVYLNQTAFIKKSVYENCRGYDGFFLVNEDTDFSLRFWRHFSTGLVPEVLYIYMQGKRQKSLNHKYAFLNSVYCIAAHIRVWAYDSQQEIPKDWFPLTWQKVFSGLAQMPYQTRRALFLRYMLRKKVWQTRDIFPPSVYIFFLAFIRQFNLPCSFALFHFLKLRYWLHFWRAGNRPGLKLLKEIHYSSSAEPAMDLDIKKL